MTALKNSSSGIDQAPTLQTDFALLTALPIELDAVLRHGGPWSRLQSFDEEPRTYYACQTAVGLSVVATCALGMGQLNAAIAARDLVDRYHPKRIILVGIAGGLRPDIQLGDIVVSEQIVDYELGKVSPMGTTPRWSVYRADPLLLDRLRNFRNSEWAATVLVPRPDGSKTIVPAVVHDVVLSGNKVIADKGAAGSLVSVWKRAAAIEMEGAGIAAVLHQMLGAPSFIVIKSICDRADSSKDDRWQAYAADVAAAYTIAFVQSAPKLAGTAQTPPGVNQNVEVAGTDPRAIRLAISAAFDLRELKILVSDLGEDWDEIHGDTKSEKIIELIKYLKRRSRLADLVHLVKKERPSLLESYVTTVKGGSNA
jgi:nucleoside phosphorylase